MPRRGLNRDQAAQSGEGNTQGSVAMDDEDTAECGLCSQVVGHDAIGCDSCSVWFHPRPDCTGLSTNAITVIQEEGGSAIQFKCSLCLCNSRSNTSPAGNGQDRDTGLRQIYEIVKALSVNMAILAQNVTKLSETVLSMNTQSRNPAISNPVVAQPNNQIDRKELYSELFEFEERKKRAKSIIVRGVSASDNVQFGKIFTAVCSFLLPNMPPVSGDVVCISREKKLYRVELHTREAKNGLLENAKKLAGHAVWGSIYISRDLTWTQRQAQIQTRAQARQRRNQDRPPRGVLTGANAQNFSGRGNLGPGSVPSSSRPPAPPFSQGTALRAQAPPPSGRGADGFQ